MPTCRSDVDAICHLPRALTIGFRAVHTQQRQWDAALPSREHCLHSVCHREPRHALASEGKDNSNGDPHKTAPTLSLHPGSVTTVPAAGGHSSESSAAECWIRLRVRQSHAVHWTPYSHTRAASPRAPAGFPPSRWVTQARGTWGGTTHAVPGPYSDFNHSVSFATWLAIG